MVLCLLVSLMQGKKKLDIGVDPYLLFTFGRYLESPSMINILLHNNHNNIKLFWPNHLLLD
jgi:hypothetical protein